MRIARLCLALLFFVLFASSFSSATKDVMEKMKEGMESDKLVASAVGAYLVPLIFLIFAILFFRKPKGKTIESAESENETDSEE